MSEYQYYEFLALDQPLSAEDLAYVRTQSRRVQPTPTQAMFTVACLQARKPTSFSGGMKRAASAALAHFVASGLAISPPSC